MKPEHTLVKARCPKCSGSNVYLDSDEHGWFEHCLQCGYTGDLKVVVGRGLELDNTVEGSISVSDFDED